MSDAHRILLLACVLLLVAGCDDAPDGTRVGVDLWALGREGEVVRELVPAFEQANPDVRVRVQQIPWSAAREKLITALVARTMPDVFQLGSTWLAEFVTLGALEPLDERLAASGAAPPDDFFAGVRAANDLGGRVYGVPWYVDTRVLFYRADLLARAGVTAPPRTWDAWVDALARVRREAGPDAYAILLPLMEWETPVILALQRGATLLDDDALHARFTSPAFASAFAFYLSLFERGLAPRGGVAAAANLYQGFAEGLFSFVVTGPWNLAQFRDRLPAALAQAWATAPMPSPDESWPGTSLAGGASLALWSGSPRKDAAWRLVAYLAEPAQQAALHRMSGNLPARRSAWRALGLDRAPRTAAFWTQLERVEPPPRIPEWERIAAAIGRHAERAIRGTVTPEAALASLDDDVDRMLDKRRWLAARRVASGGVAP
jgi:multiple sugar transport system substrate-binding protein